MNLKLAFLAALLVFPTVQAANAELFVTGSTFTVTGVNAPTSFSSTATLTSGTTSLLDNGLLRLSVSLVPTSGGAEWAVFQYSTVSGGPIGSTFLSWQLSELGVQLTQPAILQHGFVQFSQNGTTLTPTHGIFGGFSVASNPVPGETGIGVLGSDVFTFPAGPLPSLGSFLSSFSVLGDNGINQANVNGYEEALLFAPQVAAVPEPSTWAMMLLGFAGIGFMTYRRKKPALMAS